MNYFVQSVRNLLLSVGVRMPGGALRRAGNFIRDVELRRWLRSNRMPLEKVVTARDELFSMAAAELAYQPVLYLEFGVAEGDSMRAGLHF